MNCSASTSGQLALEVLVKGDQRMGRFAMRKALGIFVSVATVIGMVGCAADDIAPGLRSRSGATNVGADAPAAAGPATTATTETPAEHACAAVQPPTTLSDAKDARDVNLAGAAVFFQSGPKVYRVFKDGTVKTEVFTSSSLVRAFVDATTMILVETTGDAPEATIRVIKAIFPEAKDGEPAPPAAFPVFPADGQGVATATNFNAAGTYVFASDETSFYLLADTGAGDAIVEVKKDDPATRTTLAQSPNVITNPQIASGAVWYVRDQQRIFKVALADEENGIPRGEPTEVFGIGYASCRLAVNELAAFCSVGTAVERRDLTGGSPTTILDAQKSITTARFGATLAHDGTLYVRSEAPDEKVKHVIRAIEPAPGSAQEKLVACGRGMVTSLAVDGASVVWTEEHGGVFVAPR